MKSIFRPSLIAALAFFVLVEPSSADETFEPMSGVTVLGATASPADVAETSRLQFRLENFSSADLTLVGVTSKMAGAGAITITDGVGGQSVAAQLLIKEDETLDFETSHIWLELRDLKEPLKDGDMMPFDLIFRSGVLPGRAHAHAAAR